MLAQKRSTSEPGSPYRVPPEPNRWPSIGLAAGVHALLLAFLWIGVSWQSNTPVAIEAEVWDVKTEMAAPPPSPLPPQQAEPEPEPEPKPQPREALEAPPVERPLPPRQPDIALEREKKRKEELKKRQEEERIERERELAEQKAEQKKLDEKKAKLLAEKKEAEKKEAEKKEAEKRKLAEKEKAEKEKAEKAEKLAKEKAEKADKARSEKLRQDEMKRMLAVAGSGGSGTAEKSTAPRSDNGYKAAITAKIKGNTSYAGSTDEPGNPTVSFHVDQLPTGEIISVKKMKSSGVAAFDDAVEKGITKSSPLPKKKDGTVERSLVIEFRMKDLQ